MATHFTLKTFYLQLPFLQLFFSQTEHIFVPVSWFRISGTQVFPGFNCRLNFSSGNNFQRFFY